MKHYHFQANELVNLLSSSNEKLIMLKKQKQSKVSESLTRQKLAWIRKLIRWKKKNKKG